MKKLLIFLLILSTFAAHAQVWLPRNNNYGQPDSRASHDSVLFFPTGCGTPIDTNWLNSHSKTGGGNLLKWAIYGDSCAGIVYFWNPHTQAWSAVGSGSGSTDTTSLSNRINLKVNVLDTATMLLNYIRAAVATASFYPISSNPAGYSVVPNVINALQVINYAGLTGMGASTYATRPTAGVAGRVWVATDSLKIYYDNGSAWLTVTGGSGGGGTTSFAALSGQPTDNTNLSTALAGKLAVANNLSDLNSVSAAKTNLGLNNVPNVNSQNASNLNSGIVPLAQLDTGTLATRARAQQKTDSLAAKKIDGSGLLSSGPYSSRPATPTYTAAYYYATDSLKWFYWNGSAWSSASNPFGQVFHITLRGAGGPGDTAYITASDSTLHIGALRDSGGLVIVSNPDGSRTLYAPSGGSTSLTPSTTGTTITVTPSSGSAATFNSATHTNAGPQSAADKQREDSTTYVVNRDGISGTDTIGFFNGDTLVLKSVGLINDGDMIVASHSTQNSVIWGVKADTTFGPTKLSTQNYVGRMIAAAGGFTNPMTTIGDLIVGTTAGAATRLGIGTSNYVLTVVGGTATWQPAAFINPMTTVGDMIIGGASGLATRVAIGANTYVWTSNGTTAAWAPASGGSGSPVGPDRGIQYDSSGAFSSTGYFQWNRFKFGLVIQSPSLGAGGTDSSGLLLSQPTAAVSGTQQWSPVFGQQANSYVTGSSSSVPIEWDWQAQSTQGSSSGTGNYILGSKVNNGSLTTILSIPLAGGQVNVTGALGVSANIVGSAAATVGATSYYTWGTSSNQVFEYADSGYIMSMRGAASGAHPVGLRIDNSWTSASVQQFFEMSWQRSSGVMTIGTYNYGGTGGSVNLIGTVTAPTQTAGDNSTKLATTAYVATAVSNAGYVSGAFTPTQSAGNSGTVYSATYIEAGSVVTVDGMFSITAHTGAATATLSLPVNVSSAFSGNTVIIGQSMTDVAPTTGATAMYITAGSGSSGQIILNFTTIDTNTHYIAYHYAYLKY